MVQFNIAGIMFGEQGFSSGGIKSVQHGEIYLATTDDDEPATINAVDVNSSVVIYTGSRTEGIGSGDVGAIVTLTDSTTVTATTDSSKDEDMWVTFTVIEFQSEEIKSIQNKEVTLAGNTGTAGRKTTQTISSVTASKTLIIYRGFEAGGSGFDESMGYVTLTDSTTITAERKDDGASASDDLIIGYTVLEFN
jgi:hypothetical protein